MPDRERTGDARRRDAWHTPGVHQGAPEVEIRHVSRGFAVVRIEEVVFFRIDDGFDREAAAVHLRQLEALLDAQPIVRRALVYDVRVPSGEGRIDGEALAELLIARTDEITARTAAIAFATKSASVRNAITTILWAAPPRYPFDLVDDVDAALAFVARHLRLRSESIASAYRGLGRGVS